MQPPGDRSGLELMLCDPHPADFTALAEGPFLRSPLSLPYSYHTIHTRGQELEQAFP